MEPKQKRLLPVTSNAYCGDNPSFDCTGGKTSKKQLLNRRLRDSKGWLSFVRAACDFADSQRRDIDTGSHLAPSSIADPFTLAGALQEAVAKEEDLAYDFLTVCRLYLTKLESDEEDPDKNRKIPGLIDEDERRANRLRAMLAKESEEPTTE